jgi:HflC protein
MQRVTVLIAILVAVGFLLLSAIFIVDEREKAMVLQFGQVRAIKENPGLAFKIPFIQNVVYYDSRIQGLDTNALEVTPLDDRRLIVDAFARWRISDVSQFRRAVGVGGMQAATQRLEAILNANVREALGSVRSESVLSADRVGLMNRIRDAAIIEARGNSAQILQEAEGYRARVVNAATGEASRFTAVQEEYVKAPEITRKRLYLETMQDVLGNVRMFVLDTPTGNASGIVPYLPLNELKAMPPAPAPTGGTQ